MEFEEAFFNEEMESLNAMFSNLDSDFIMQMQNPNTFFNDFGNVMSLETSNLFQNNEENNNNMAFFCESFLSSNTFNNSNSSTYFSPQSSTSSGINNATINAFSDNKNEISEVPFLCGDFMEDILNNGGKIVNADDQVLQNVASGKKQQVKRKVVSSEDDQLSNDSFDNPKKKSRVSPYIQKNRQRTQPRKNKKSLCDETKNDDEIETNAGPSTSGDDSQELGGGEISEEKGSAALKSNAKARATRGSATDPQSLYARRRRERINERLKILQNLVPNGTKVDISTMLEEAVDYVKFLQIQIKLLSSDDLWMYAPIAYNGMDLGVYQTMFQNL